MHAFRHGTLVAARYREGLVVKGRTTDFLPNRNHFHVAVDGVPRPVRIATADLKALFFIKTEKGNPDHEERKTFRHPGESWVKLWIVFECDGEELAGWTMASLSGKNGFFMIPTDQESNIEKMFVFRSALKTIRKGPEAEAAAREYAHRTAADETAPSVRET